MTQVMMLCWGLATGLFYFGGLWLTLWLMPRYKNAVFAAIVSLYLRLAFGLLMMFAVTHGRVSRLLWMLPGFLAARLMMTAKMTKCGKFRFNISR